MNSVPIGINHLAPYRSASLPAIGAVAPVIQTPTVAVAPMVILLQPVSLVINPCMPPSTTPATLVDTKFPKAPVKITIQP